MNNENFMGLGGFLWFSGVVEDRQDPLKAGRVRVRILGQHTENKIILPTEDLPWALVMLPVTASGVSGIGQSATGLLEGSWVFGFFRDGQFRQEPVILGSLPGRPTQGSNSSQGSVKGFSDPNGIYPKYVNEPDVNRLAVNNPDKPHPSLAIRKQARTLGVPTADFNPYTAADGSVISASDGNTWNQPELPYASVYPYNHVYESESGHIVEIDDTKDNERIHLRHMSGTGTEIHPNGDQTTITNNSYSITKGLSNHYITGDSNTTIDGHHKLFINKSGETNNHYDIHIGPNASINIIVETGDINLVTGQGKVNVNAGGDYNLKVGGNMTVTVAGEFNQRVNGGSILNTSGTVVITGETIDLNP
jgi:hypothetical protein